MNPTSLTLLQKLVSPEPSTRRDAWTRFASLYTPLLLAWSRRQGLQESEAADFVQEVLMRLARVLPDYRPVAGHRFRGWLFTLVRNRYLDFREERRNQALPAADGLSGLAGAAPPDAAAAEMDEREYRLRLVRRCLELIRGDFSPQTWEAFRLLCVEGEPVEEVARALNTTVDAAHAARRRVLERLREELAAIPN